VRAIRNEYDDAGRLVRTLDADGHAIAYTHDIAGRLEQVRDRRGHLNSFAYDERGRVLTEINALGETTSHTYDDDGNETSRTDGLGHTSHATFDARGNRLTETDALGHTTTSTYDAKNGLLTQTDIAGQVVMTNTYADGGHALATTTDANGATTTFTYDTGMFSNNTGELHGITDALNHTTTFTVDFHGWRTQSTDPKGHVTTSRYDNAGREFAQYDSWINGDGGTETDAMNTGYDLTGRITARTRPAGGYTSYGYEGLSKPTYECESSNNLCTHHVYDAQGRETQTVFMDGTSESSTFDENGNTTSHTDRNGHTTRMVYDDANRLTETIYPDNTFTSTHYDAAGRVDSVSDERGHVTTYGYDDAGRQTTVTDALDHTTTTAYDTHGRRESVTDALGHATHYTYDAGGRLTRTTYDDGTFTSTEYDLLGRKTADTDQAGRVTRYTYDLLGRLATVVLPNPATGANPALVNGTSPDASTLTTSYQYDELGRKTRQTDALGRTTAWYRWSPGGQYEYHDLPGGQRERSQFDERHRLIEHYDFNGRDNRYRYDVLDRVTQVDVSAMPTVTMTYTPNGQIAQVNDGNGTTAYTYDARDRMTRVTWPDGQTVDYAYDASGNRTQLTTANQHVDYTFDELNRLQAITATDGGTPNPTVPAASYTYDAVGNRASVTRANGTSTTYAYNNVNRLTGIAHKAGASLLLGLAYTLDPSGMRTSIDESGAINRHVDYTYDAVKRLTGEAVIQSVGNRSTAWTYDAVGNRLTQNKTVTSGSASTAYTYDVDDRLKTEVASVTGVVSGTTPGSTAYTYDDQGNLTRKQAPDGTTDYGYDSYNHMVQLSDANGVNQYAYTYDGTRLSQTNQANTANAMTTRYLVDPNTAYAQVIEEKTQQGSNIAALSAVYTVGDDRVRMYRTAVAASGSTPAVPASLRYYHADGLGSERLLTDDQTVATDAYAYEAFGQVDVAASQARTPNTFLFTGEQLDPNPGFYFLRARYMSPGIGRFTQMDSFDGFNVDPTSLHKYLYANSNPAYFIDPSGHASLTELISAMNSFVALQLRAISLAGSARLRGLIFQRLGRGIEMYVNELVESYAERAGAEVARNYGIRMFGKRTLIDFIIRIQGRLVYLEVKYGIPQTLGPAMSRLVKQLELSLVEAAVGETEADVVLFSAVERESAQSALTSLLGESASEVEIANGLIELSNVLRQIFSL
jgi:RHS repeat-associated protein